MGKKLGMDAKLYYDETPLANGAGTATWQELDAAREVTTNLEASEADVTTRANDGWRATQSALKDATLDFEVVWDPDDAGIEAVRDAFLNNTDLAMAIMDGDIVTPGSEGFVANFRITGFSRAEPLEDAIVVSVTAKPSSNHQWYEVGSS